MGRPASPTGSAPGPNGRFDGNNAKDVYARFDYKFGGMGLDGDTGGEGDPRGELARRLAAGRRVRLPRATAADIDFPFTLDDGTAINIQDAHFLRTGFYASCYVRDLNVFGAYLHGTDTLQPVRCPPAFR